MVSLAAVANFILFHGHKICLRALSLYTEHRDLRVEEEQTTYRMPCYFLLYPTRLHVVHSKVLYIEEGRAASKSPHYKFGCFLSISQQAVSADITKFSAAQQRIGRDVRKGRW
jgi:hypothetical protein